VPTKTNLSLKNIPQELRDRPQWVLWRWVERDGGFTKVPFQPRWPSRRAMTDSPQTWGTFEQAVKVYEDNPTVDGVGYVFAADDKYCGIDFDGCIDGTGEIDPFARQWSEKIDGYQERSVSDTGIHAVVVAGLPGGRGRRKANPGGRVKEVELYDRNRFFCFTGRVLKGFDSIEENQQVVDEFLTTLFPPKPRKKPRAQVPTNLDDAELLDRARNSASGRRFMALYDRGDASSHPSPSEADFALINMLIFWCAGDAERVIRLFEQSALYREGKHRNYVADSVANALASYEGSFYDERRSREAVKRTLPPFFNLLLQPIWTERKAVSAYKAYAALLIMATERGVKTDEGIRVGVDIRTLAELCNVGVDTLSRNALPWLLKKPHQLVRWRRGKGDKAGYFILLTPAVESNTIYPRSLYSVGLYGELRQLIRLCYGRSKKSLFGRLGSLSAMVLLPLVIAAKQLTLDDLAEKTGRKASHLKSVVAKMVEASLVVEACEGVYRLPTDFWQRLDIELEKSGIAEAERMRKRQHDGHREIHLVKLLQGRGLSPNTIALKVGISVERVKEMLKPPDKVPEAPEKIRSTAEVFALARAYFPDRDGLPDPPPRMLDPLVHVGTEKAMFFKGGRKGGR
jgi:NrS-1  polymerase HBD domain